jgi:predicted RNA-binding protein YlxR (DUF448 family)
MKVKKIPMRTCVVTNEKLPKVELLRIVKTPEGEVKADPTGKMNGRGAYIKKSLETVDKAQKTKVLEHHLECKIEDSVYEEIKNIIK